MSLRIDIVGGSVGGMADLPMSTRDSPTRASANR
jgi:hypothetical protein